MLTQVPVTFCAGDTSEAKKMYIERQCLQYNKARIAVAGAKESSLLAEERFGEKWKSLLEWR